MYYLSKRMEISAAHKLNLDYESKCKNLHGHGYIVEVFCKAKELNHNGMVTDFADIKKVTHDIMDHNYLNDIMDINPTAENMAKWICDRIPNCYKVSVQETEGNIAIYEKDGE